MQSTAALRALLLPARSVARLACSSKRAAIRCLVQQRAQQQPRAQQQQPEAQPSASAALALSSLLLAAPAFAEEGVTEAADAAQGAGVTALGWALIASPIIFYGLFNVYRSQIDPKAKFGDALFVFAALIIVSNIVSITVFKVRLF